VLQLGVLALAAALAPQLHAASNPTQPANGSVVATQTPTFVVAVTFTGDPFPHVVVSTAQGGADACWARSPITATGENSGTFGCQLPEPLPPGTYTWRVEYASPVCAIVNCASPSTTQGPFTFTVGPGATAGPIPAQLETLAIAPRAPKAGGTLSISAELWVGGSPQDVDAVSCLVGSLRASPIRRGSRGGCAWKLPRTLAGKTFRGALTLYGPADSKATVPFSVRVRR
jgi:hypothetical protein